MQTKRQLLKKIQIKKNINAQKMPVQKHNAKQI